MWAGGAENVVVVAVRAEKEISKAALTWSLTHVVRPGDLVTLLAVLSDHSDAKPSWRQRLWGFSGLTGSDCGSRRREKRCQISASCSQMALQIDGQNEINVRIKVVGSEGGGGAVASPGVVAAESRRVGANWVVLDKQLKQEEKHCMEELQCNIVVMKGSSARVLRLNLGGGGSLLKSCTRFPSSHARTHSESNDKFLDDQIKHSAAGTKETRASTSRTAASGASSHFVCERNPLFERNSDGRLGSKAEVGHKLCSKSSALQASTSNSSSLAHTHEVYWIPQNHVLEETPFIGRPPSISAKTLQDRFFESDDMHKSTRLCPSPAAEDFDVREVVSLFKGSPSIPPPLCSLCRHKAPVFGKPPRQFSYQELEEATDGFSDSNFLAEGAFGHVHRGVLGDGRVVAVKRLKEFSILEGEAGYDHDVFLSEVEVLSRAQHRNVVMLVGYCVQGNRRVLVYEYICNGSLDLHLFGRAKQPLDLNTRTKIAVGVARGLRYLHEDCRVGFVVHRDLRPNNILLTHDFEALVGDFNPTRAQAQTSYVVETHSPQTFGYLAPEYIEHGIATYKTDVYAFGVVLLELITGRRALDPSRAKGQQFLAEWARPFLLLASEEGETTAIAKFLDPFLSRDQSLFFSHQVRAMACVASLCLRRDPGGRPTMSKVLRILEGDTFSDPALEIETVGSRSGRMSNPISHQDTRVGGSLSLRFPIEAVPSDIYADRKLSRFF